ncbi:MAG: DUF362 domain-containing protein [Acidobacteria bacterium]|nr:DUF362 domain-containing protein [Acidobacteriota bacterium]
MNRREFFYRSIQSLAIAGLGRLTAGCSFRSLPVTALAIPDLDKDYHRDFARVLTEDSVPVNGKRILLKPNFVEFHKGHPVNTDIRLIRQISEACFRLGAKEVIVAEAAGHRRDPWYSTLHPSLRESLDPKVRCLDLNHGNAVRLKNKGAYTGFQHFYVAAAVANADVVISMPKLKTHHWVGVTLSLKNLFGVLPGIFYGWPKNPLHLRGIPNSIVDLALTVPVHYAIVDGVIGMEGDGPIMGTAKHVGVVIMGRNLLAVDSTAARIMGFNPRRISYMEMASAHFPGLNEYSIAHRGENPKRFATRFACLPQFTKAQATNFS